MNRRTLLSMLAGVAALTLWAAPAGAQGYEQGKFDLNIGGGVIMPPNSSALKSSAPILNIQGRIFATQNIGLGFSLDYSRTETDNDIFPLGEFRFTTVDSTTFVALKQAVATFHYQFIGTLGTSIGEKLYPYVLGGIGGYTIYLDPQQTEAVNRVSDLSFSLGGAIKWALGTSSAIELSVRDVIYTDFDRDDLNPLPDRTCRISDERQFTGTVCSNERFPFLNPEFADPNWSEPSSTVHNIVLMAAFSFVPGS